MPLVLMPQWTVGMLVLHGFLAVNMASVGWVVRSGILKIRYSKFRGASGLSGRTGMFILYFVPLVVHTAVAATYLASASTVQWLVFAAVALHFAKRCAEVLFVHSYSGPIDVPTTVTIAFNYSVFAGVISYFNTTAIPTMDALFFAGVALYVVGQLGNLQHHVLLAKLRTDNTGYFIPKGGLFGAVTAPHYLFEIVAWLGVALMSRHLATYLIVGTMTHYLSDRANSTRTWYLEKFPDFPKDRKRLVPFIY